MAEKLREEKNAEFEELKAEHQADARSLRASKAKQLEQLQSWHTDTLANTPMSYPHKLWPIDFGLLPHAVRAKYCQINLETWAAPALPLAKNILEGASQNFVQSCERYGMKSISSFVMKS